MHEFTLPVPVLKLHVLWHSCCETEKFGANLCFNPSEDSVQTAGNNNKVTSQILETTLILYAFEMALYFESTIINNQI